jgi:hypothetical protein
LARQGDSGSFDRCDPQNGLLLVTKGENRVTMPWSKNHLTIDSNSSAPDLTSQDCSALLQI